jgi:hypothetical protein
MRGATRGTTSSRERLLTLITTFQPISCSHFIAIAPLLLYSLYPVQPLAPRPHISIHPSIHRHRPSNRLASMPTTHHLLVSCHRSSPSIDNSISTQLVPSHPISNRHYGFPFRSFQSSPRSTSQSPLPLILLQPVSLSINIHDSDITFRAALSPPLEPSTLFAPIFLLFRLEVF